MKKNLMIGSMLALSLTVLACTTNEDGATDNDTGGVDLQPGDPGYQTSNTVGGVTFKMVYLPGKTTFTGAADGTQVTVANEYEIAETEVTYELWNAVYTWATSNGYTFSNAGTMGNGTEGDTNQHPVTTMNWRDAMVWCNALTEYYNDQNGTSYEFVYTLDATYATPIRSSADGAYASSVDPTAGGFDAPYVYPNAKGFRLPTMNEWELAAKYIDDANNDGDIMDDGEYYPGNYASGATAAYTDFAATSAVAWFGNTLADGSGNTTSTQPVKQKTPNALGLYDMSGNVWEWNFEWNPIQVNTHRSFRGGGWNYAASGMQIGGVYGYTPDFETTLVGFRLARGLGSAI